MERVRAPDQERIAVMEKKPVAEILNQIPASYIYKQQANESLKACCKDISNLTYQAFKTEEKAEKASLAIIECNSCGCKHYRQAVSPGRI